MPIEIWVAILGGLGVIIFSSLSLEKKRKDDNETKG